MNQKNRLFTWMLVLVLMVQTVSGVNVMAQTEQDSVNAEIDQYVNKMMKKGEIPGLSLSIVENGEITYMKSYGKSDIKNQKDVENQTKFQLSSNSKAFTALGIALLVQEGKIDLEAPVSEYLDWFSMNYKGKPQTIKVKDLLYHMDGLSFQTIQNFTTDDSEDALEQTVKNLVGTELAYEPEKGVLYTSMGYDILGLLIQQVSQQPYEEFMHENIMKPLGLEHTGFLREHPETAKGYKVKFCRAKQFDAPDYYSNTPAGYIISDIEDFTKWMQVQLGNSKVSGELQDAVALTHKPNSQSYVAKDGSVYAMGWLATDTTAKHLVHGGNNPNYCSYMSLDLANNGGVAVLANISSSYVELIGKGVKEIADGKSPSEQSCSDTYALVDKVMTVLMGAAFLLVILLVWRLVKLFQMVHSGTRTKTTRKGTVWKRTVLSVLLLLLVAAILRIGIPFLLYGLNWNFIKVWLPASIIPALSMLYFVVFLDVLRKWIKKVYPITLDNQNIAKGMEHTKDEENER